MTNSFDTTDVIFLDLDTSDVYFNLVRNHQWFCRLGTNLAYNLDNGRAIGLTDRDLHHRVDSGRYEIVSPTAEWHKENYFADPNIFFLGTWMVKDDPILYELVASYMTKEVLDPSESRVRSHRTIFYGPNATVVGKWGPSRESLYHANSPGFVDYTSPLLAHQLDRAALWRWSMLFQTRFDRERLLGLRERAKWTP